MIPSCVEDHHLLYSWSTTFSFEDNFDKGHWWGCTTHPLLSLKNSRHLRRKPIKNILSSFQALITALRQSFVTSFPCSRCDWCDIFSSKPYFTSSPSPYLPADQSTVSLDATAALQRDHRIEEKPSHQITHDFLKIVVSKSSGTTYQFTDSFSPGKTSRASKNWRNFNYFSSPVW